LLAISVADMTRPTGIDWCRDNKSLRRKDFRSTFSDRYYDRKRVHFKLNFLSLSDTPPVVPVIITIFQENRYHFGHAENMSVCKLIQYHL
jgi:hypothetical protein